MNNILLQVLISIVGLLGYWLNAYGSIWAFSCFIFAQIGMIAYFVHYDSYGFIPLAVGGIIANIIGLINRM